MKGKTGEQKKKRKNEETERKRNQMTGNPEKKAEEKSTWYENRKTERGVL